MIQVSFNLITALLSLQGNLEFVDDDQEQASVVNSDENLNVLAYLLGSEPRHVEKALCYRVVAAGQKLWTRVIMLKMRLMAEMPWLR